MRRFSAKAVIWKYIGPQMLKINHLAPTQQDIYLVLVTTLTHLHRETSSYHACMGGKPKPLKEGV